MTDKTDAQSRLVTLGDSLPKDAKWDDYRAALTAAIEALAAPAAPAEGGQPAGAVGGGARKVNKQLMHWNGIPVFVDGVVGTHPHNWPLIDSAGGATNTESEERARKLYEPDEYEDAFKGRTPQPAGGDGAVAWNDEAAWALAKQAEAAGAERDEDDNGTWWTLRIEHFNALTRPAATVPEQIVIKSGSWVFLADKTNIPPLNSMPVYQTKDGITSSAKLAQTLVEPIRKMNTALTELKADGVYKCCQGTYEACLDALHDVRKAINK